MLPEQSHKLSLPHGSHVAAVFLFMVLHAEILTHFHTGQKKDLILYWFLHDTKRMLGQTPEKMRVRKQLNLVIGIRILHCRIVL